MSKDKIFKYKNFFAEKFFIQIASKKLSIAYKAKLGYFKCLWAGRAL